MRKKSDPVLALFFVSGLTGLIYESVWSHYVKLFLGHAAYAQTLVLVVFIGGLALGAWLCARVASRLRNPLRIYALVEASIGVIAFAFHAIFTAAVDWGYATLLPATCDAASSFCAAQWLLSAALLAPQSILLGATFPLVSSAALRMDSSEPGHDIAALYFLNSLGAVLGVLASAFLLIPSVGLPGTLRMAGYGNVVIAVIAWLLSRAPPAPLRVAPSPPAARLRALSEGRLGTLLLATAFLTGLSSFIYEIVWIRMLSLVLGASTHSFELMLAAFILGLALGGAWIRWRIDASADPMKLLGRVQVVMGLAALATLPIYNGAFDFMAWMLDSLARNDAGFVLFNTGSTAIALLVMLPATFCAGMTLPLITYRLLRSPRGEQALGMVYAVNTLGSIMGVVIAVHVLLTWLGLRGTLIVGALVDVGLGIVLLAAARGRSARPFGAEGVAAVLVFCVMAALFNLDMRRLSSGVFRGGAAQLASSQEIIFHRDGKTATVDVLEGLGTRSIRTNGKSDAAIAMGRATPPADEYTMALLAILPLSHKPEARTAAVIGFGSGMSTAVLLASPALERVDTIEIEPAMVEGAKLFRPIVEAAYSDPRSHVVIDDAKSFFARGGQRYDILVSEPSNPWVSGVASLFTEEFYARVAMHLNEGGVLSQWLHMYEMDTTTFASIVAAASKTFGDFVVYASLDSDVVLIARKGGNPGAFQREVLALPQMRPWLARLGLEDPELVRRRVLASGVALTPFLKTYQAPANSDFFPVVDQRASKTRFTRALVRELIELQGAPVPMLEMLGASPVPSKERHSGAGVIYVDGATAEAWLLHDALAGERPAANIALHQRAVAAHWIREWTACRTGVAFRQVLPTVVDLAETINPRLHPDVAAALWKGIGESACGKALGPDERPWVALLEAIARRDSAAMVSRALPILGSRGRAQGPEWDLALLAGVTGLLCEGEPARARDLLATGVNGVLRPGTRLSEVRLLDAMTKLAPMRCGAKAF